LLVTNNNTNIFALLTTHWLNGLVQRSPNFLDVGPNSWSY